MQDRLIVIGVDAHKRTHTMVATDAVGRRLAVTTVEATSDGHLEALEWATRWPARRWAVEDCRHLTRTLESDLLRVGEQLVRVPTKMMSGARRAAREAGKSDPIDALPQTTRARPSRLCRPLQHPQAASRSRADTAGTRAPPTPRRCEPAEPALPTRPTRRTDPRIPPSSMTDGFAYPTRRRAGASGLGAKEESPSLASESASDDHRRGERRAGSNPPGPNYLPGEVCDRSRLLSRSSGARRAARRRLGSLGRLAVESRQISR
jgi:Transposase